MSKHYLSADARIGPDRVGDTVPVYVSLDGSQFSLDPAGIARAGRLLEQKVRTDGGGKFVQPPVSDDQIGEVLSSILA